MAANKKKKVAKKKSAKTKAAKKSPAPAPAPAKKKAQKKAKPSGLSFQRFLTPLDDRIVIQVESPPQQTAGGLYIPSTASEKSNQGLVIGIGRGQRSKKGSIRPMDVAIGDRVLFREYDGLKMDWQGQQILILREDEILGVVI